MTSSNSLLNTYDETASEFGNNQLDECKLCGVKNLGSLSEHVFSMEHIAAMKHLLQQSHHPNENQIEEISEGSGTNNSQSTDQLMLYNQLLFLQQFNAANINQSTGLETSIVPLSNSVTNVNSISLCGEIDHLNKNPILSKSNGKQSDWLLHINAADRGHDTALSPELANAASNTELLQQIYTNYNHMSGEFQSFQ